MKLIKINMENWAQGIEKLSDSYQLFGPVKNEKFHEFKKLDKGEMPDLTYANSRLSPKSIVYEQSEVMFEYSLDENEPDHHIMKEVEKDYSPRAVIGIRPCDAKSFKLVQRNFDNPEYKDPFWINSYNATVFIGFACNEPCSTCFCTSVECGPFHEEGLDLLLIEKDKEYYAKVITQKGQDLLKIAGWSDEVDIADNEIESLKQQAESKIKSSVNTDKLKDKKTTQLFEAPFWEEMAFACINCGTCTYSCPTCWCFDIQDEVLGKEGVRMRNWDSCMYPLFTLHGSGHNPRTEKYQRVRQRFMHKLKYYIDKYDNGIQCVGCGRCIRLCPVNIDIRSVCNMMNQYEPEA
ncbi:sulfhydrogenase subunit beta (sulfur reductase) [Candidatus Magnetomoraceae bacterium gMMP-15]